MLPNQTLRGTPKALMHVTVLTHSSSRDSIHWLLKKDKTLQTICLPHKDSLVRLGDYCFSTTHAHIPLMMDHKLCFKTINTHTHTLSPSCMFADWEISLVDRNKISQPLSRPGAGFIVGTFKGCY